jgi:hypothetical protein
MTCPAPALAPGRQTVCRRKRIMSARTPIATRLPAITVAERANRQREVDFARGNVRHEGGILSDEIERLNARYIAGEIDSDTLTAAILQSETARP